MTISSTSLEIAWNKVSDNERNGNITHYEIFYVVVNSPQLASQPMVSTTGDPTLVFVLKGLEEYMVYNVSVRAVNVVGFGPLSPPQANRTFEDGKKILTEHACISQYHLRCSKGMVVTLFG